MLQVASGYAMCIVRFVRGGDSGVLAWLLMLGHDSKRIQAWEISRWAQGGQKAGDGLSRPAGLLRQ